MQNWYNKLTRAQLGLLWVVDLILMVLGMLSDTGEVVVSSMAVVFVLVFLALGARGQ